MDNEAYPVLNLGMFLEGAKAAERSLADQQRYGRHMVVPTVGDHHYGSDSWINGFRLKVIDECQR